MIPKKKTKEPQATQEIGESLSPTKAAGDTAQAYEPMTGSQAAYLKSLSEEVHEPGAFHHRLSRKEATRRIDSLREKLRLDVLPPHTD